jgi:hypothetical protein
LGEAFGALSARLDSGDILPGAQLLLERMKAENPGDSLAKLGEALGALSARLDTKDILPGAQLLLEQMRAKNSGDSLAKLGEALGALSAKLDSRDILLGAQLLLEQIVGQTGGSLEKEGRVLWALCSKLNGEETIAVQQRVLEKIPTRSNLESLNLLAETFAKCGSALRKTVSFPPYRHPVRIEQAYVDLLKKPLIVGKARTALVDALEKASGQVFDGDQWRFVDWATQTEAGRAMKLDLKGQPSWK